MRLVPAHIRGCLAAVNVVPVCLSSVGHEVSLPAGEETHEFRVSEGSVRDLRNAIKACRAGKCREGG
jgi:hypothetical protein